MQWQTFPTTTAAPAGADRSSANDPVHEPGVARGPPCSVAAAGSRRKRCEIRCVAHQGEPTTGGGGSRVHVMSAVARHARGLAPAASSRRNMQLFLIVAHQQPAKGKKSHAHHDQRRAVEKGRPAALQQSRRQLQRANRGRARLIGSRSGRISAPRRGDVCGLSFGRGRRARAATGERSQQSGG